MDLLTLYKRESPVSGTAIIVMGAISAMAQSFILGIITISADTASYEQLPVRELLLFLIAFAMMFLGKRQSLQRSIAMAEGIVKNIRIRLTDKIRNAELLFLEQTGRGEIYTRLANDTNMLSQSAVQIIYAFQSAIIVVFCLIFVAILSKAAFLITFVAILMAAVNYLVVQQKMLQGLRHTLNLEGRLFDLINQLLNGFKELRANHKKNSAYFEEFSSVAEETQQRKIQIGKISITAVMYADVFLYFLLAIIVFLMPRFAEIEAEIIIRITAALLFMMGPLSSVVGSLSAFATANAAARHLFLLEEQLDTVIKAHAPERPIPLAPLAFRQQIRFENVTFSYLDHTHTPLFTLGPFDLTVHHGEILFIIGGNGSGKTTLLKVLTGLYAPDSGTIQVDDYLINKAFVPAYRELFASIFTEFHLFERFYGVEPFDEQRVRDLIHQMEIADKTDVSNGAFTNINLSTGQRKRLAMITALLDDRPLYILDEWAADQDPHFRKYYYEVLLPELKAQGKTIIAISHDDRYFHCADRILKMEYGQFVPYTN